MLNGRFGLPLILLGACLLLLNLTGAGLSNWWAFFILPPALFFFGMGWDAARRDGGPAAVAARTSFGVGLILCTVFVILLFGMSWAIWWPAMVIVPGLAIFWTGVRPATENDNLLGLAGMARWTGGTAVGLGLTFLMGQLGLFNLQALTDSFNWWGIFILVPALGAFWQAVRLLRRSGPSLATTWLSLLGVMLTVSGMQELLEISWQAWEGVVGAMLILSGAVLLLLGWRKRG